MHKYLNPAGEVKPDFYITATLNALNKYMQEIERMHSGPQYQVSGTITYPGTPPVTVTYSGTTGYWVPKKKRFTYSEVKNALWCGDPNQCFINLFNLIGKKLADNFCVMKGGAIIGQARVNLSVSHFAAVAAMFYAKLKVIGAKMTPELFLDTESEYIRKAIKMIPLAVGSLAGPMTGGIFTGTVGGNLGNTL